MEEVSKSLKVIKLLKQVMDLLRQKVKCEFKQMNLTGPQGMLVGTLAHSGKMKISDLSEKLVLSNSTVSGIIDRLEKQGLVERIRSEEDRRVVYVNVTPEFKKSTNEHFSVVEKKLEATMQGATLEELDSVIKGLETLKKVMDRQKESPQ